MWDVGHVNSLGELIYPVVDIDSGTVRVIIRRGDCSDNISIVDDQGDGPELDWLDFYELYEALTAIKAWKEGHTK